MIVKAREKDFIEIMLVYKACAEDMNRKGLFNWNTAYPGHTDVMSDLEKGNLYLYRENNVTIGVVCLNEDQPLEYENLEWKYDGPFLVVHRLAVHPDFRNRNIGQQLMQFAADLAAESGYHSIRLDAITVNPSAMRLYQKAGYEQVGPIHFAYQQDPFMCMELKTREGQK